MSENAPGREFVLALAPVALLGAIAAVVVAWVDTPALAAILGAGVTLAVCLASWRASINEPAAEETPAAVLTEIRADHRRPTIDRESGLLTEWYFRLRAEEEVVRARRYGQPFTLLNIRVPAHEQSDTIVASVREQLREVDFAGDLGVSIVICLPNTPREGASAAAARLAQELPAVEIAVTEYPGDGETLSELLREETWDFSHPLSDSTPEQHRGAA